MRRQEAAGGGFVFPDDPAYAWGSPRPPVSKEAKRCVAGLLRLSPADRLSAGRPPPLHGGVLRGGGALHDGVPSAAAPAALLAARGPRVSASRA
eukprot:gene14934-11632_t